MTRSKKKYKTVYEPVIKKTQFDIHELSCNTMKAGNDLENGHKELNLLESKISGLENEIRIMAESDGGIRLDRYESYGRYLTIYHEELKEKKLELEKTKQLYENLSDRLKKENNRLNILERKHIERISQYNADRDSKESKALDDAWAQNKWVRQK